MNLKTILVVFSTISLLTLASTATAQRPLQNFRQRLREAMPKGELLKKVRERMDQREAERKKEEAQKKLEKERQKKAKEARNKKPSSSSRPTPADPRNKNELLEEDEFTPQKLSSKEASKYKKYGFRLTKEPPAMLADAGVKKGDRVLGIGGTPVESMEEVRDILDLLGKGDRIEVVVDRRGKKLQMFGANGKPDPKELANAPGATTAPQLRPANNEFQLPKLDAELPTPPGMKSVVDKKPTRIQNRFVPDPNVEMELPGNELPKPADEKQSELERLRRQVQQLKKQLREKDTGSGVLNGPANRKK